MRRQHPPFSPITLLNRRWWWSTLLVLAGMLLLARLGIWQLDRLEQRRTANQSLEAALQAPPLSLNEPVDLDALPNLSYRQIVVTGVYDLSQQVRLTQQYFQGQPGAHLLTPLLINGQQTAVLVDRGWVPKQDQEYAGWPDFPQPGTVTEIGYLRPSERLPNGRQAPIPTSAQQEWFRVDIPGIQAQLPYPLLSYYVLAQPQSGEPPGVGPLPYREPPLFDLSEGPHLSYAIQWFIFTLMLGGGYVYLVWRRQRAVSD